MPKTEKSKKESDLDLFSSLKEIIIFKKFEPKLGCDENSETNTYKYYDFREEVTKQHCLSRNSYSIKTTNDYPHVLIITDSDKYDEILSKLHQKHNGITSTISIKDYDYLLRQFLITNQEAQLSLKLISTFFEKVHKIPTEKYKAVSLISGIYLQKDQIDLGNFKIKKTDLGEIEKDYGRFTTQNIKHALNKNEFFKDEKTFYIIGYEELELKKIKDLGTDFLHHASSVFDKYFNDLIKFVYFMHGRRNKLSLKRKFESFDNGEFLDIYNLSNKKFSGGVNGAEGGETLCFEGGFSIFNDPINDIKYFYLIDKQKSGIDLHLYNAIIWSGKSLMNRDLEESFMQLFVGLESLSPKGMLIDDFVAFLLGKSYEDRLSIKKSVKNYHDIRSRIVHQNIQSISVSENEYYGLLRVVKNAIYKIFTDEGIKNMDDLRDKIEKIKYS